MDRELRTLLQEKAEDVRLGPQIPTEVLRRSRRRRLTNGLMAGAVTVALLAAFVVVSRLALTETRGPKPRPGAESPETVPGVYPFIFPKTEEQLKGTRAQVAQGSMPLWTDPEGAALLFAVNVLGWDMDEVEVDVRGDDPITAAIANPTILAETDVEADVRTILTMELAEGEPGDRDDVYVVSSASTDVLDVRSPAPGDPIVPGETVVFEGRQRLDYSRLTVGAQLEWVDRTQGSGGPPGIVEFRIPVEVLPTVDDAPVATVAIYDAERALALTSFRLGPPEGSVQVPVSPPLRALPEEVAATRDAILAAVRARDWEGLRALIPESGFTFSYGGETDAIAHWQAIEGEGALVLPTLEAVLDGPFGRFRGTFIWPSAAAKPAEEWTGQDRAFLQSLIGQGLLTERELRAYERFGGSYLGWRVGIERDGTWVFYVAGD